MKLKKLLLGFATFAVMAVLCAICAGAENYNGFNYNLMNDGTVKITGYNGKETDLSVPAVIGGNPVSVIGSNAFDGAGVKHIVLPDSLTSIGYRAFAGSSLETITIPSSVTSIGNQAFAYCKNLKSLVCNADCALPQYAFSDCGVLSEVKLGNKVTALGYGAFQSCKALKQIELPASLTEIGAYSFNGCVALEKVSVLGKITSIGSNAFDGAGVKHIVLPDSLTSIGYRAFAGSSLETITIPSSVTSIGNQAFAYCKNLKSLVCNADCALPQYAFSDCGVLSEVKLGNKVTALGYGAFQSCKALKQIELPASLTEIGAYSFNGCVALEKVSVLGRITTIGSNAFDGAGVKHIVLPDSLTSIGYRAFANSSLEAITIPSTVTTIGDYAFAYCKNLKTLVCNADCALPEYAFVNCTALSEAKLGDKVTAVGYGSFEGCKALKQIELPASLTKIGAYSFNNCVALEKVSVLGRITTIGSNAFDGAGVKHIVLPDSLTSIGYRAFANSSLEAITIPSSVTTIGNYAFAYCKNLKSVRIGETKWNFESQDAFYGSDKMTLYYMRSENCLGLLKYIESSEDIANFSGTLKEIPAKSISFKSQKYTLVVGESLVLSPIVNPVNATNIFSWSSSDSSIADVNSNGEIFGVSCGKATISYTSSDGISGKCVVNVVNSGKTSYEELSKKDISSGYIVLSANKFVFSGKSFVPQVCVFINDTKELIENVDYKLTISDNSNIGKATVAVEGIGDYCGTLKSSFAIVPGKVTNFKVKSLTSTNVTLQWNKNTSVSGYEIEQYKGGKWVNVAKITSNATISYTVKGLAAGTAGYKFRMRAVKDGAYSDYTSVLTVNTNPYGVGGFKCSSKTSTSVTLKWNKGTTASGYQLQQYKDGKWVTIYTGTKATNTSYTVKGLKAGTAGYRFRIRAYKTYGNTKQYGSWSSEVKVNTNPYGVSGFKCSSKTSTSVTLKWNKGTTASGYQLQQYKDGKWVTIYTGTKATNTSYTVKGLKAGTAGYRFRIRAYKTYGNTKQYGSWSSEVKVNTNPYGVGGFKAKSTAKNSITLGWNKGTTASGYQLQQYKGGKWVTVYTGTKATSTSYTVKSLKSNTSYKFRIRAYKTYGNTKQYGSWSSTLTVKTKR